MSKSNKMKILAIESTAHTFGIAIIEDKKVLINLKRAYTTESGGIIPINAANYHMAHKDDLLEEVLNESNTKIEDIDLLAYSAGPGLSPCLRVGRDLVKELNEKHKIPFIEVNHCVAHLEITKVLTGAKDPVLLYASGANTQVIAFEGGKYRIFGETLDQGIGNFLDSFARYLGLGFPGGPKISDLADKSKNYIELPYSVKGMDISLTGMLTKLKQLNDSKKYKVEDLAYSLQETAFAMLLEVSERAMAHCDKKELALGGGVACNTRLKEMSKIMCKERGAKCFIPENQFLVDNAAMIGLTANLMHAGGHKIKKSNPEIYPYQRTDQVIVDWE
jgi:N6-L-threonylcarbamoyladenine synthase